MNTQKILNNSDQDEEGCPNKSDGYSESFVVVDIETLSSSYSTTNSNDRDASTTTNSRTNFQRSLSRKVSSQHRGKPTPQKDSIPTASLLLLGGGGVADDLSIKASLVGDCTSDSIHHPLVVVGSSDLGPTNENIKNNKKGQQAVTITAAESSRWRRSYSRQRSSSSPTNWTMNPKRILFFFATLSSMGTIILIYFTLTIWRLNNNGEAEDYS